MKIFKEDALKKELSPDPGDELRLLLPKVQHENIVQMFGMWQDSYKNTPAIAIVMEFCDESLATFMKRWKKLSPGPKRKLGILRDIAEGMLYSFIIRILFMATCTLVMSFCAILAINLQQK